ncbi:ABC transporter ATP-binding protein [Agreia pratensis]|uniref:ABC transporter ATP-binding protein n=1 Tax=Agreia pratensis TaxID=150121 RepID=UPI00188CDBCE|nr:ABC transporter ATP-binding protein [Agreia pratensis]MBF4636253.1 ABC transporter ATP-binding protein [Agreia pratensis]
MTEPVVRSGKDIVRRTIRRNRGDVAVGTVLICLHQLAETSVAVVIGLLIDQGVAPGRVPGIIGAVAALALVFLIITVSYQAGMRRLNVALQNEAHHLRMEVSDKALSPQGMRTALSRGELLTVSSTDAEQAAWFLDLFPRAIAALAAITATAVALILVDLTLGAVILVATPVFFVLARLAAPLITARTVRQQSRVAQATALAGDLISGLRSIKGIGGEAAAFRRYGSASSLALSAALSTNRSMAVQRGLTVTMSGLAAAAIASTAGWYALTGRITAGELVTVVGLAQFIIEPLTTLSGLPATAAKARGSAERVAEVLTAAALLPGGSASVTGQPSLRLDAVHHGPLTGLDLEAHSAEITAVYAHDSADGAALAAILSGRTAPDTYQGIVKICGIEPSSATPDALRQHHIAEPHEANLFSGSIRSNITADAETVDEMRLTEALRASAADQVVALFPEGLGHRVTDRGRNLSGGQRQRLALARALYSDAPVLVLHEPSTAVDSITEQRMADGIRELRATDDLARHVTVVITGSPALLAMADRVIVLRNGRATTAGRHQDLLKRDPQYAAAVTR